MGPSLTRTILRRRKTIAVAEEYNGPVFPIRELPYELQLMVGRECVLTSVPIIVGKTVARWHSDPQEEMEARLCSSMLNVSKDFRKELYRFYYETNTFELGYYYDKSNFFSHPGKNLVQYVLVDALRVLVQPVGVPSTILDRLKLLNNLKQVSIRLRGSLLQNKILYESGLAKFLIRMAQALSIDTVELLIEPTLNPEGDEEQQIQDYRDFLDESLSMKAIWPKGMPANRKMINFRVSNASGYYTETDIIQARWEDVSDACLQRHALNLANKQVKTGRIKNFINSRRSSTA